MLFPKYMYKGICQKQYKNKINQIASGLLLVAGILMLILHLLVGVDDVSEIVWIVPFVLSLISAVVIGIFHLRSEA